MSERNDSDGDCPEQTGQPPSDDDLSRLTDKDAWTKPKSIQNLLSGVDKLSTGAEGLLTQQKRIQELLSGVDKRSAFQVGAEGLLAQQKSIKKLFGGMDKLSAFRVGAEGLLAQQKNIQDLLSGAERLSALRGGAKELFVQQKSIRDLFSTASGIANSPAFQALVEASLGAPSLVGAGTTQVLNLEPLMSTLTISDFSELEIIEPLESAEAELVSTLVRGGDISGLSAQAKLLLWLLGMVFTLLLNYLALQNGARQELCFLQPKILPGLTVGQTGKAIRQALCEFPIEVLVGFRFIDGDRVNLRAGPSTKAEVLGDVLIHGQVVQVVDSSNRSWLLVRLVDQEVEGWVFRRYTHKLTK